MQVFPTSSNAQPRSAAARPIAGALAALAAGAVMLAAAAASAGTVHLTDGSQVVGTIQHLRDDTLTVETDFAGTLTIPQAKIEGVSSDRELAVTLASGDRVVGTLDYSDDAGQQLTNTVFGEAGLGDTELIAIARADAAAGAATQPSVAQLKQQQKQQIKKLKQKQKQRVAKVKETQQEKIASLEQTQQKYADPWTLRFELGVSGATGNNERLSIDGRAEANRETPDERLNIFSEGHFAKDNGERSENEVRGGAKLEVDVSKKLFVFGKTGLEFDEFEDLDLRSTVTAGLGYFFWEKPKHVFKGRIGAGYQHESFMDGESMDQGLVELGYDYRYDFEKWLRFTHNLTYYPTLDDFIGDYRVEAETAGEIPLSDDEAWKLRLGVRNEYDAQPQPGIDNLDTFYFLNFVYDVD
jgi:putative salt-induced outer membrane protein